MNRDFGKRLKRLEEIRSPALDSPVIIELLDNGEREIYTMVNGKKIIFTDEEWRKSGEAFVKSGDVAEFEIEIGDWSDDIQE